MLGLVGGISIVRISLVGIALAFRSGVNGIRNRHRVKYGTPGIIVVMMTMLTVPGTVVSGTIITTTMLERHCAGSSGSEAWGIACWADRGDAGWRAIHGAPTDSGRSHRRWCAIDLSVAGGDAQHSNQKHAREQDRRRKPRLHINTILVFDAHGSSPESRTSPY